MTDTAPTQTVAADPNAGQAATTTPQPVASATERYYAPEVDLSFPAPDPASCEEVKILDLAKVEVQHQGEPSTGPANIIKPPDAVKGDGEAPVVPGYNSHDYEETVPTPGFIDPALVDEAPAQ